MKNTFGNSVAITLIGESHGEYIGAVLDGLAPGIEFDREYIEHMLTLRRPDGKISTPRKEKDEFRNNPKARELLKDTDFFSRVDLPLRTS